MPNQPKTPNRSIRVPDDLWRSVMSRARESGTTVTAVVIAALRAYVQAETRKAPPSPVGEDGAY